MSFPLPRPEMTPRKTADAFVNMLQDDQRMRAYRAALEAIVRPDHVVADVGTGLGVLALFAARAGAKKVYAVERQPGAAELARAVFAANGYSETIEVVEGDADALRLPEKVDVVCSEMMGNAGVDEQMQAIVGGFCRLNLKPDGVAIPARVSCMIAPCEYTHLEQGLASPSIADFDFSPLHALRGEDGVSFRIPAIDFQPLATPVALDAFDVGQTETPSQDPLKVELTVTRAGLLRSFAIWFEADMAPDHDPDLKIENRPGIVRPSWSSWLCTLYDVAHVAAGDRLTVAVDTGRRSHCINWRLRYAKG